MKSTFDKIMPWVTILLIIYGLILGSFYVYKLFYPNAESTITFNVIGITNSTNATTLAQIHFECIKYCVDSRADTNKCWDQCKSLGKETCDGD